MPRSTALTIAAAALLIVAAACQTSAPPPPSPPAPAAVQPAPEAAPAPPPETVRVTGSKLNVRSRPTTAAASVARVRRGDQLAVLGRDGEWVQVKLADGTVGWVSGRYVAADAPCPADKASAELLSDVPLSLREGATIGQVVIDATVDASGSVASTKVVQDTTGTPELRERALAEVKALRFSPPVRKCKPVPFVYTYTRNF